MRGVFVILILLVGLAVCYGQTGNRIVRNKHHKHCHKWHLLHKFYFLTFLALKFKAILVVGSIWAIAFIFGKVFAAMKIAEYMKKSDHPEITYSKPPHYYDHKSIIHSGTPSEYVFDSPPSGAEFGLGNGYSDSNLPPNLPPNYGRSYNGKNNDSFESLNVFFENIRRSNLTETVFKEMDLNTKPCKMKFVCEADFNARQNSIVDTIFNMFIDDSYQKYRTNVTIKRFEDCSKLNPTCDKVNT